MIQSQCHGFMPPQAAREQQCEQCSVAFSFQSLMIGVSVTGVLASCALVF
jgi:hypothetical protein